LSSLFLTITLSEKLAGVGEEELIKTGQGTWSSD
jgi:hypothetical protein